MMDFILANSGTIITGLAVALIVIAVIIVMVRNKKKGKTSCGCGCENCPSAAVCHKTDK